MLTSPFCHLPGIGETTERKLWDAGVTSWQVALEQASRSLRESWTRHIQESIRHYEMRNAGYFAEALPSNQQWRLYRDFRDACAFVDIETTGLYPPAEITTAALYDGRSVRYYVNGDNLHQFPRDLRDYALLVTYNGKTFDIPFIERYFRVQLRQAHIDLRYPLRSLGLAGGLKACERQLGMARPGLEDINGFFAVLLWKEYRTRGNQKALETLLAYNIRDTISLHALMVHAHNERLKGTPFSGSHSLPAPSLPDSPVGPDKETVTQVRQELERRMFVAGGLRMDCSAGTAIRRRSDSHWEWFSSTEVPPYEIAGKYLFFSGDRELLVNIAIQELQSGQFHLAKIPIVGQNVADEYVLCLYYGDESRHHDLAAKYRAEANLRYRCWKTNEATRRGEYSDRFRQSLGRPGHVARGALSDEGSS